MPAEHHWGTQTQRSLIHFSTGDDNMPTAVHRAYGYVKNAATLVNAAAGRLERDLANAIVAAADEGIAGKLDPEFPAPRVAHRRGHEPAARRGARDQAPGASQRPRQHGQSPNDTFPTAMHIATLLEVQGHMLPRPSAT